MPFRFEENDSQEQNIESFFDFLRTTDPEFANILAGKVEGLRGMSEGQARNEERQRVNAAIAAELDPSDSAT